MDWVATPRRLCVSALVVAATVGAGLASATSGYAAARIKLYPVPSPDAGLSEIVAGPDGALWFGESNAFQLGRITTSGQISETPVPKQDYSSPGDGPAALTSSGGALWVLNDSGATVLRMVPGGVPTMVQSDQGDYLNALAPSDTGGVWAVNNFGDEVQQADDANLQLIGPGGFPDTDFPVTLGQQIMPTPLASAHGSVWAADDGNYLKNVTDAGVARNYPIPSPQPTYYVSSIALDRHGNVWFTEYTPGSYVIGPTGGAIGELKAGHTSAGVADLKSNVAPHSLVLGPDGAMWFAWSQGVGRINPSSGHTDYFVLAPYKVDDIAFGSDGALWFVDQGANDIGRIDISSLQPTSTVPTAKLAIPKQRLSTVRRSGRLRVTCRLSGPGACAVAATVPARTARRLKLKVPRKAKTVTLGHATGRAKRPGALKLTLRLSPAARRALRRVHSVTVTLTATSSASGVKQTRTSHKTLKLSR